MPCLRTGKTAKWNWQDDFFRGNSVTDTRAGRPLFPEEPLPGNGVEFISSLPRHLQPQEPACRGAFLQSRRITEFPADTGRSDYSFIGPFLQVGRTFHTERHIRRFRIYRPGKHEVFLPPSSRIASPVTLPHGLLGSRPVAYFIRLVTPSPAGQASGAIWSSGVPSPKLSFSTYRTLPGPEPRTGSA